MIFNKKQFEEIEKICSENEVVKLLWEEYQSYLTDPSKIYYTALTEAIIEISKKIKDGSIDVEDPYTKSILRLAETGEKVFSTLEIGNKILVQGIEDKEDSYKAKKINKGTDIAV